GITATALPVSCPGKRASSRRRSCVRGTASHHRKCSVYWVPAFAGTTAFLRRLAEPVVQRVAGAPHGADRIGFLTAVERLAQPADMDVDRALVDIDLAAPHAVEQLLAREHAARPLHHELPH